MTENEIVEDHSFIVSPSVILAPQQPPSDVPSESDPLTDDPLGLLTSASSSTTTASEGTLISFGETKSETIPSKGEPSTMISDAPHPLQPTKSQQTNLLDIDFSPSDPKAEAPSLLPVSTAPAPALENGSVKESISSESSTPASEGLDLFDPLLNPGSKDEENPSKEINQQLLVDSSPLFPTVPAPILTPAPPTEEGSSTLATEEKQETPSLSVVVPTTSTVISIENTPLSPATTIDRARLNELLGVTAEMKSSSTSDILLGLEEADLTDFKKATKSSPSSSSSSLLTPTTSSTTSSATTSSALGEDSTPQKAVSTASSTPTSPTSSTPTLPANTTMPDTPSSSSSQSLSEFNDPLLNPVVPPKIEEPPPPPPPRKLLFEHFLVVGLPTDAKIETGRPTYHEPQVLYQYPPDKKLAVPKVPMFCFPEGVKTTVARRTNSLSNLNEIFYGQSYLHSSENSFVFILTGIDNAYLYGMCVTKQELLREAPSFLQKTKAPVVGNRFIVAPRCYCLLSRYPFFSIHFEVLYSILAQERLIRIHRDYSANLPTLHPSTSSPAVVSSSESSSSPVSSSTPSTSGSDPLQALPVEDPLSAPTSPVEVRLVASELASPPEEQQEKGWDVTEILERYYYTPVPEAGETTKITFPNGLQPITFSCPRGDTDARVLADWCLHCTFRILSLENILRLFTGLMLEKPIVIVCKNLGLLSTVVLSLIPLLRPLVWQGLLVPVLPAAMQDMLQAPVPYIAGIQTLPDRLRSQLSETMMVYLETNEVISSLPLLPLPEEKKLQENLRHFHTMLYRPERTNQNPLNISQEQLSVVHSLLASVNRYTTWFMESISSHFRACVIGGVHESDQIKASFLQKISPHNRPFVQLFLDTQHFSVFIDTILRRSRNNPGGPSSSSSSSSSSS